jgi:hypothetical protein
MKDRHQIDEINLETEVINVAATQLYVKLGFIKDEKRSRYYLNGGDAFRLSLQLSSPIQEEEEGLNGGEEQDVGKESEKVESG